MQLSRKARRTKAAVMIYTAWNIWKERNRRVFDQRFTSPSEVLQVIKNEIMERRLACGGARVIFLWLMFSCFHLEFEFFFNYVILVLYETNMAPFMPFRVILVIE